MMVSYKVIQVSGIKSVPVGKTSRQPLLSLTSSSYIMTLITIPSKRCNIFLVKLAWESTLIKFYHLSADKIFSLWRVVYPLTLQIRHSFEALEVGKVKCHLYIWASRDFQNTRVLVNKQRTIKRQILLIHLFNRHSYNFIPVVVTSFATLLVHNNKNYFIIAVYRKKQHNF